MFYYRFQYSGIIRILPDEKIEDQFTIEYDQKSFVFKTAYRSHLLCQLYECMYRKNALQLKFIGPFDNVQRVRKNNGSIMCRLTVAAYGIVECNNYDSVIQEYKFINISKYGIDSKSGGFFIEVEGRMKIFSADKEDCLALLVGCREQVKALALDKNTSVHFIENANLNDMIASRALKYTSTGNAVMVFDVSKVTRRSVRPVPRQMHISEEYIVEKDSSGFQNISYQHVRSIYALVRSWVSPRDFTIEYNNGTSRTYACAVRDTLLATLLDICHAIGNVKVIITGEISDCLRLMPRHADENYHSSIKDAFFGASSIESFLLTRIINTFNSSRSTLIDSSAVELACRELNANVPCPGVAPNTEINQVKGSLSCVLRTLSAEVLAAIQNEMLDNSRLIVTLLQTLYRIIPCVHGYKCFLEVKEVDTRLLLLQIIKLQKDFVNYWTLEVLSVLCRCPLLPRGMQQEFVNKHTLLTEKMLRCLIDLMSNRVDEEEEEESNDGNDNGSNNGDGGETDSVTDRIDQHLNFVDKHVLGNNKRRESGKQQQYHQHNAPSSSYNLTNGNSPPRSPHAPPFRSPSRLNSARCQTKEEEETVFFPNSLVIVSAAALLESVVSSKRDTSSPELLTSLLDLLGERSEVLIHMLRSSSFLIMENAAILMFVLLKNRGGNASILKELALSECLTLKHFYLAVYSPSATQRFISRFLANTWMSGSAENNPGKALLIRMIPLGKCAIYVGEDEVYMKMYVKV